MPSNGIAPGCVRITVDIPNPLAELLYADAERPPAIPTREYVVRLIAHHFEYPLPTIAERRKKGLTLGGAPRKKPGPKPKDAQAES